MHSIPNLKTRDKWWSRGGTTGVSSVLWENLKKVKKAIHTGITSFILDPVARVVATECLTLIISFIEGATAFLEQFYQQLKADATNSSVRRKSAWDLTMEVFLQIWRDIAIIRSPSSGIEARGDVTIAYLWDIVQAQRVMDDYERHFFENHPSISSILTRHQSQNNSEAALDMVVKKNCKLEESVSSLKTKLDAQQSHINTLKQKVK